MTPPHSYCVIFGFIQEIRIGNFKIYFFAACRTTTEATRAEDFISENFQRCFTWCNTNGTRDSNRIMGPIYEIICRCPLNFSKFEIGAKA